MKKIFLISLLLSASACAASQPATIPENNKPQAQSTNTFNTKYPCTAHDSRQGGCH